MICMDTIILVKFNMSNYPEIPLQFIQSARETFSQDTPLTDDLVPGTFFDNPDYFDSIPRDAKVLACAIIAAGEHPGRSSLCHSKSEEFFQSYLNNNTQQEYLWSALALEAMALRWMSAEQPERGRFNYLMSLLFIQKFELSSNPGDLDQAIRHSELAMRHTSWNNNQLSSCLTYIASLLKDRYCLASQEPDYYKSKQYLDQALELTDSTSTRLDSLSTKLDLARVALERSQPEGITCLEEGLALLDSLLVEPQTTSQLGSICLLAGRTCMLPYFRPENQLSVEKAISYLAKSIVLSARGDLSIRISAEQEYAEAHAESKVIMNQSRDRRQVSEDRQELVRRQPHLLEFRVQLADLYQEEGQNTTETLLKRKRLDEAVELMEDAISVMPAGFRSRGKVYNSCSAAYYSRFEERKLDADINRAIECSMQASTTPFNGIFWSFSYLHSQCLLARYEKDRNKNDLTDALTVIRQATTLTDEPPALAKCKWIKGKIIRKQYNDSLEVETLRLAIDNFNAAVEDLPKPSTSRNLALHDLGNAYSTLFMHDPQPELMDKCVAAFKESVTEIKQMYQDTPHPDLLMLMSSLAGAMLQRYRHSRLEKDLESSISYYRKALDGLSSSDPRYAPRAGNLCQALRELFQLRGEDAEPRLLTEGNTLVSKALRESNVLGREMKFWLEEELGNVFHQSFSKTKLPSDRDNAIASYDKALAYTDVSSRRRADTMMNKATLLQTNARNTNLEEDFKLSCDAFEEISKILPEDDPSSWESTHNHAKLMFEMYKRGLGTSSRKYGITALGKYKSVSENATVPLEIRITSASVAASLAYSMQDAQSARDLINFCLQLLPKSVLLHASRVEQLSVLRKYHYIPSGAAALSIAAGDSVLLAIQRLEIGRANLWERFLGQSTMVESLSKIDVALATKFNDLQLKLATITTASKIATVDQGLTFLTPADEIRLQRERDVRDHQRISQEQIGVTPGFLDLFNDTSHLQKLAVDAPIVFINASEYRSDALIIVQDREPFNIRLPGFNMDAIKFQAAVFLEAQDKYASGIDESIENGFDDYKLVMKWLWESAAKPVIESIDFSGYARGPAGKPRIIWVATGWMSLFPIHAAGDFGATKESGWSVHDRVVSSYTLSLRALEFAKRTEVQRIANMSSKTDTAMIIGMRSTPGMGQSDLNVEPEMKAVEEELKGCMNIKLQLHKGSQEVKDGLKDSIIAHFACHGLLDSEDPSKSALLLQDCAIRNQLKQQQPFCVWIIIKMQMEKCGLVYLSACDSGANRDLLLRDEGLHVAGAFHLAGVPHVVSALWKVRDSISADLARYFYANLKNNLGELDLRRSGDALHIAVQRLRDQGENPMLWGPFVHSGP